MIIAVDTGGTKTLVARFSERGALEAEEKISTPKTTDEYIKALSALINKLSGDVTPKIISIGLPDVDKYNYASSYVEIFSNLPWKKFDVVKDLSVHFPTVRIIAGNDANVGGVGEVRSMHIQPKKALYIAIGTGIGTGVISKGEIDPSFIAAEGGLIQLEYDGLIQVWEKFASGKAVYDTYGKTGAEIHSKRTWYQIADRISRGLIVLLPVIRPNVIIIGGSMGTHFPKYSSDLISLVKTRVAPVISVPTIIQAKYSEHSVIYGCYYRAIDSLKTR